MESLTDSPLAFRYLPPQHSFPDQAESSATFTFIPLIERPLLLVDGPALKVHPPPSRTAKGFLIISEHNLPEKAVHHPHH